MRVMARFRFIKKVSLSRLPKEPGVYCFKDKQGNFLYIGKATNLRKRVKDHFQRPGFKESLWLDKTAKVGSLKTDSEIEALLLEAQLIKKHRPTYNKMWRDDKNYFYIGITREKFPRVFVTHQIKKIKNQNEKRKTIFIGPFIDGRALKRTLGTLRKIFPYYTTKKHPKLACPWCHLDLCPGPNPDKKAYQKNIRQLKDVLQGKRKQVLTILKKEMKQAARDKAFERAAERRDKIFSLEKVITNARVLKSELPSRKEAAELGRLLKATLDLKGKEKPLRLEAYDVSNIQGKEATGSMVVFVEGQPAKDLYRKFKITIEGRPNDVAMIRETLKRRLQHPEWGWPDLILIDGGKAQLSGAMAELKTHNLKAKTQISVMALAKRRNELFFPARKNPLLLKDLPEEAANLILHLRDEAHRFAIGYHRKLREKRLRQGAGVLLFFFAFATIKM